MAKRSLVFVLWSLFTSSLATAQTQVITGRVIEAMTRRPLSGARVTSTQTNSTVTDANGVFRVTASTPARSITLRVTMLGYEPASKTVSTGAIANLEIELTQRALGLDQVVVTGTAGPARIREVGHSVAMISTAQVREPVASMDNLLSG
jgi:hypothetical protein